MTDLPLAIGLDIGTSATKGLLVDAAGRIVARAERGYGLRTPRPGWTEQDPEDWWRASVAVLAEIAGAATGPIVGLGLSGQMHGSVFLDPGGRPLRAALLWNDQRTAAQCREIERRVGPERLREITGNPALTGFLAPKILWLREHEPEAYRRLRHVLLPKDYVRYRLSGALATDTSDAAGTLLLDLRTRDWSDEILGALEVPRAWLPAVLEGPEPSGAVGSALARRVGLPPGLPVVAGGGDNAAAAVGTGVIGASSGLVSLGTSGVVFVPTDTPVADPASGLHAFCHAMSGGWHLMGVVLSAGGSLRWFRDTVAPDLASAGDAYDRIVAEALTVAPGADGVAFLPYLAGERTPHMDPDARGAWTGLSLAHDRRHMARAVLEGIGFALRDCAIAIEALGRLPPVLEIVGGGARSAAWRQMLADILGVPLRRPASEEGPAMGAAILAMVGAGVFGSLADATGAMLGRPGDATEPDAERSAAYREIHARWRALYPALRRA